MAEQKTAYVKEQFEKAQTELIELLGVSWKRQNLALTVHLYSPEFKCESLLPAHESYRAHFAMGEAWDRLVRIRALTSELIETATYAQQLWDDNHVEECSFKFTTAMLNLSQALEDMQSAMKVVDLT